MFPDARPGGKPVMDVPAVPILPVMIEMPVLVMLDRLSTAKVDAKPKVSCTDISEGCVERQG